MKLAALQKKIRWSLALGTTLATLPLTAQSGLQETRDVLSQWVETRQITSKEQSDWRLEQSILSDTRILLQNELDRLNTELESLQASDRIRQSPHPWENVFKTWSAS